MPRFQNRVGRYPDTFSGDFPHSEWIRQPDDETTLGGQSPMDGQVNIAAQDRVQVPCPARSPHAAAPESHRACRDQDGYPCDRLQSIQSPMDCPHPLRQPRQNYFCLYEMIAQLDEWVEGKEHRTPLMRCSQFSSQDRTACHARLVNPTNAGRPRTMRRQLLVHVQHRCGVDYRARYLQSGKRVRPLTMPVGYYRRWNIRQGPLMRISSG